MQHSANPSDKGSSPGQTAAANRPSRNPPRIVVSLSQSQQPRYCVRVSRRGRLRALGALGAGAVAVAALEVSPQVLWLHMLAVAADLWSAGCVFLDVLGACSCSPSPATSAIRTTNRKYRVRTPYSAWRCKQAPRSAMPSVGSDIFCSPVNRCQPASLLFLLELLHCPASFRLRATPNLRFRCVFPGITTISCCWIRSW